MASNLIENRQIRIFISSTFTDMEAERNLLIKYVFPQLRVEASKRNVSLMTVDLRWGITEEEYKRGKILEICLSEIENSHPFFIGILGDRYGWQPDTSQIQKNVNLKERYPWITDDLAAGLSVTEIEMQFGVLRKQAETNACFFIKQASDSTIYAESTDAQHKLQRLKEEVMSNGRYPYYLYSDVKEIGQQVKTDFMVLLDKYFPEKSLSALESERTAQRSVLNALCSSYIPIEENFTVLNQFLDSEQKQFCITGASGLGKSALMANWIKQLEEKNEYTVIYHFVGTSDTGTYYENILKRFADEISDRFSIAISDEDHKKKPEDFLNNVIFRIPSNQKVVLIIDAVNQINETNYAKQLTWLPGLSQNVKLVLSTLPDDDTFAAINRRKFAVHTIKPLERQDRVRMVTEYLKCFGKTLTRKQLLRIITNKVTENTLVLKTLLNQLILFGRYEELDQRIDYYLEAQSISEFFQKVLQRSEEDYGKDLTRHALSLIGLSRNGMSESELTDIMQCTPVEWSQVYCAFVSHFNIKNGLINFAHTYLKEAVSERYLRDLEANKKLRVEITAYFEGNEEPRALDEQPYQYYLMEDNEKLYRFLMNIQHFDYLFNKDELELCKYWQRLREDKGHAYTLKEYIELFEKSEFEDKEKSFLYYALGKFSCAYISDLNLSLKCNSKALHIRLKLYGEMNQDTARSYDSVGSTFYAMGQYKKASEYRQKALSIRIQLFGEMNQESAESYNKMGIIYYKMDLYAKALENYEKALAIQLKLFDERDNYIATSYNNIACVYLGNSQYDKAIAYLDKALKIRMLLFGEINSDTAYIYNNLGAAFSSIGQNEMGLKYNEKALNIRIQLFGIMHPDTADSYKNVGNTYRNLGMYKNAFEQYEKSFEIDKNLFGENHPNTARDYDKMGLLFKLMGQYTNALSYCEKGLKIRTQLFGEDSSDIAVSLCHMGDIYESMGLYKEALTCHKKALKVQLHLFGETHINTVVAYNSIALTYESMQQFEKALEYNQKALKLCLELCGDLNQHTAANYDNLGSTYQSMRNYDKAIYYKKEALRIRSQLFGIMHPETAISYFNLASVYKDVGQYDKALHYYEKSLQIDLQLFGEMHPETANCYHSFGIVYKSKGQYKEALEYCNRSLQISLQLYGGMNPNTATYYNSIGDIYDSMDQYKKSIEYYTKSLQIRLQLFGEMDSQIAITYNNMGTVYQSMGQFDSALSCYEKALAINLKLFGEVYSETSTNYNNLGSIYNRMEQYATALNHHEKALRIRLQLYGEMNPETALSYDNIGYVYDALEQYDKALDCHKKALHINLSVLGELHPDTAISYKSLGRTYASLGQRQKAFENKEKAYEISFQLFEDDLDNLYDLAETKRLLGKYNESINLFATLETKSQDEELSAAVHLTWGINLFYLDKYEEALAMHLKACEEKKGLYGEDSNQAMNACDWVGRDYLMLNELDKAISILTTVYQFYKDTDPDTALFSYKYLAIAHGKSGEKDKAIKMLEEGLQQFDKCDAKKYANKGNYLYDYASYLYEGGDFVKALKLAEEGLHFMQLYYGDFDHPHKMRLDKLIEDIKPKLL